MGIFNRNHIVLSLFTAILLAGLGAGVFADESINTDLGEIPFEEKAPKGSDSFTSNGVSYLIPENALIIKRTDEYIIFSDFTQGKKGQSLYSIGINLFDGTNECRGTKEQEKIGAICVTLPRQNNVILFQLSSNGTDFREESIKNIIDSGSNSLFHQYNNTFYSLEEINELGKAFSEWAQSNQVNVIFNNQLLFVNGQRKSWQGDFYASIPGIVWQHVGYKVPFLDSTSLNTEDLEIRGGEFGYYYPDNLYKRQLLLSQIIVDPSCSSNYIKNYIGELLSDLGNPSPITLATDWNCLTGSLEFKNI